MKKPEIRARIDKAFAEHLKRTGINQDRVIRELVRITLVNPTDVINMDEAVPASYRPRGLSDLPYVRPRYFGIG
ncbi:MAG: terminase small subunit [Acetivibrionales bacterium]